MQVTKELISGEIQGMEKRLELARAAVSEITGALNVLRALDQYLDVPEPKEVDPNFISEENAAIQAHDEELLRQVAETKSDDPPAMSVDDLARAFAGAGAEYEVVKETPTEEKVVEHGRA